MEACRLTHSRDDCGVLNGLLGMRGVGNTTLKKKRRKYNDRYSDGEWECNG